MAGVFVGGAVLGAAFGELFKAVTEAKDTVSEFRPQFNQLSSTLSRIGPIFDDIERFNRGFDRVREMDRIQEMMTQGVELVKASAKVGKFNFMKKLQYSEKLAELNKSIAEFFAVDAQAVMLRDVKEALAEVQGLRQEVRMFKNRPLAESGGGYFVDYLVPQAPEVMSWGDAGRCFKKIKVKLLQDGFSPTVLSAPGGCGKTTLVTALCHDEEIKGKFCGNILFIPISKTPNLVDVVQRMALRAGFGETRIESKERAGDYLRQLLQNMGQKPLLIVLDDVWSSSESMLEKFVVSTLPDYKIIVASRFEFPAFGESYRLKPLDRGESADLFHRIAIVKTSAYSFESPPLHSPLVKSPVKTSKNIVGSVSSLHPKSLSTARQENNANASVHPLPLPPSAALHSPSSRPQASTMTEIIPLKGQWNKGKLIGRGTFGRVYFASNRETGALCAMKEIELCADDPKSQECMKQLEQEINMLSWLKHPNIVQYYGSEIVDDRFYIYLEYVHPGSINKYVRDHCGAITESVVRNFTRHILSGLAYLHRKKTIHRDIKGANLLVDASGVVKLADFGMAKHLTGQAADLSLKGSPYWMAPELIYSVMKKDNSDHAFAVDIWSLGCTIIEMLTGKPPWGEFEGAAAMFRVLSDTPSIPDMLSSEGKDFLRCCFRRNPAERPSATKLLDHRFLKSSPQLDLSLRGQPSFARRSMDMPRSMQERTKAAVDKPILPSGTHNTMPKTDYNSLMVALSLQ